MGAILPRLSKFNYKNPSRREFQKQVLVNNMEEMRDILEKKPFTFTNVRHPYERLVSAYVDLIVEQDHHFWFPNLKRQPFDQFLREEVLAKAKESGQDVLFSKMNLHWRPYNSLCSFCNVKYDVISKTETFGEDKRHILKVLREEEKEEKRLNVHGGASTADLTRQYFSNISQEIKSELFSLYKHDFAMFEYDPELY